MIFLEVAQRITGRRRHWGVVHIALSAPPAQPSGARPWAHGHHRIPQEPPRRSHHWLAPQGWIHSAGGGQRHGCWDSWQAAPWRVHRSGCRSGCRGCLPGKWPHYLRFSSSFLSAVDPRQPRLSPSELQHGPETEKHHPPRRVPSPGPPVSTSCRGGGCPASCHQVLAGA